MPESSETKTTGSRIVRCAGRERGFGFQIARTAFATAYNSWTWSCVVAFIITLGPWVARVSFAQPPDIASTATRGSEPMKDLQRLVGAWTGKTTIPDSSTAGGSSSGMSASFRWVLRQYHLEGLFQYTVHDIDYEAQILWSYDWQTRQYTVHWIDNLSSQAMVFQGAFIDDSVLELQGTRLIDAQVVHERLTWRFVEPDRWDLVSENDVFGDNTVGITIEATRKQ